MEKLTPRQKRFVGEYLINLNATQSAIKAGYSQRTANEQGSRLLADVRIKRAIAKRMQAREQRTAITQDRVLQELAHIAFFDVRKLYNADDSAKFIHELDDATAAAVAGLEGKGPGKKYKLQDKVAALAHAMRHLGMFQDHVNLQANVQGSVEVYQVDLPDNGRC